MKQNIETQYDIMFCQYVVSYLTIQDILIGENAFQYNMVYIKIREYNANLQETVLKE